MKMKGKTKWLVMLSLILSLGILLAACDNSDDDDEEVFTPHNMISLGGLVSMQPDATLDKGNVTQVFKTLDKKINPANTISLTCMEWSGMYMMVCPAAGSATVEYCQENPLSYDVVFDGCMADRDNGIASGTMTADQYDNSKDFYSLTFTDYVPVYMGTDLPPVDAAYDVYVFKSGKVLGFMLVGPGTYLVMGMHPDGKQVCDLSAPATVTVDFGNNLWTSDGGCDLPLGPVEW